VCPAPKIKARYGVKTGEIAALLNRRQQRAVHFSVFMIPDEPFKPPLSQITDFFWSNGLIWNDEEWNIITSERPKGV
jgi:hypothetical protein